MTTKVENKTQALQNPKIKEGIYLLPRDRAYYRSWLNNIEHYMLVECSNDDQTTTVAKTPASNTWESPFLPGIQISDVDKIVHVKDLELGESFVFNVRESITDPIKMIEVTHE